MESLGEIGSILNLISSKQKAISSNLANIDTVGYQRKDVDFSKCMGALDSKIETRLSKKMGSSLNLDISNEPIIPANELIAMQRNYILYSAAVRNISSTVSQIKTVSNVGK